MPGSFTWTSGASPGVAAAVISSTFSAVRVTFSTPRNTGFSFVSTPRSASGARAIQAVAGTDRAYTPSPTTRRRLSTTTAAPQPSGRPMRFSARTSGTRRKYSMSPTTSGSRNSRAVQRV
jgi:hypothetical protein